MKEPVIDLDTGEIVDAAIKRSKSCSVAVADYYYDKGYRSGYEQAVKDYDLIFEQMLYKVKNDQHRNDS